MSSPPSARWPISTRPRWLEGVSLLPLVRGEVNELHREIFAELTYHAAYEPQRAIRPRATSTCGGSTPRHPGRVLANVDDGLTKRRDARSRVGRGRPPVESLYDLWLDPAEGTNRIDDPLLADMVADLAAVARLDGAYQRPPPGRSGPARRGKPLQHGRPDITE